MMNKNTGGPAFPLGQTQEEWMNGMTLRDYFAGQAIQALMECLTNPNPADVAEWAYKHADAMIAEREKRLTHG